MVPNSRIQTARSAPINAEGAYVLYWMTSARRASDNFSLDRAIEWATKLRKPLVILEALRVGYRWASDRLHRFAIEGMADNAQRFAKAPVHYHPYLEPTAGAGKGLVETLAHSACAVVTDDFPCFFLPRMLSATAPRLPVLVEKVDSNGALPMRLAPRVFERAVDFRRFAQRELARQLLELPNPTPFAGLELPRLRSLPKSILERWPAARLGMLDRLSLAKLPIDHAVEPGCIRGGTTAGEQALEAFLRDRLATYGEARRDPDGDVSSGLSPYLHFGHVGAHAIFRRVMEIERWTLEGVGSKATGSREGWWGVGPGAEAFLDQLIVWRELGFNRCCFRDDYDQFDSLPAWALQTLAKHAGDPRPHRYELADFERAATCDRLWNAAQTELVRDGRMHNYLRMLWGKKILEWSESPRQALAIMIELNNKYALDGRDPNSYSGIFWTLGRYDRPWAPERPVLGVVRYMSSESAMRKLSLKSYLRRYDPRHAETPLF